MLFYTGLLFLVIAVSLDGFGVGITYGMRKIHVPIIALSIIMFCSGVIVFVSMTIGNLLSTLITPDGARIFGGIILIGLGLFSLWNVSRSRETSKQHNASSKELNHKLANFKKVISMPDNADLDYSGVISVNEAFLLGFALALDAFGAGIGASMLGYSPVLTTVLIAIMSGLFVFCGIRLGLYLSTKKKLQRMRFIPPLLLILLGISNIL